MTHPSPAPIYRHALTARDLADLTPAQPQPPTLQDEITLARAVLRRLAETLHEQPELPPDQLRALAALTLSGANTIAQLLRHQRALTGDASDGLTGALGQALDELATLWEMEL